MEESVIIRRNPPDEEENSSRRDEVDSDGPFSHCILFEEAAEKEEMQVARKLTERSNEEMLLSQDDVKIPES